jgi:hypothetical protein
MTAFHFWFINRAEGLLEDLVESRSNGKLKLQIGKFKFNWFSNDMQLRNAVFYSTDTATASTSYRFKVDRINVRVKQILPLVFENKILIDSLGLINPDIQVTRLRSTRGTDTIAKKTVSLPHEMGRVYKSIQDALKVLQVNRFRIENGKFTLINKIQKDDLPVSISNIQFNLDNLQVDTNKLTGHQKILFSDNVALQTHNQDIHFPDGRHRLTFSNFRINLLKKLVEFDSCTISAGKGDSSRSSFKIFFDRLQLTNIDFDTLYQKEIIKADSVYCINPRFRLDVELDKKGEGKFETPKLDELIQQLTGDLRLGFVIVKNGSFDINTVKEGRPSSFTSDNNNFEMQGLRIQKNAPNPLTVKSFAMAIRNYENFLRDSTYAMEFDSILLLNNSIYLSNFSLRQMEGDLVINSFRMPQFELRGLSWDDLVFDRRLSAEKATLYQPVIDYTVRQIRTTKKKKLDVFETLAGIGDIIHLNKLDISNGTINIDFRGGTKLKLENATMSLLSQNLVESNRVRNLQGSVNHLAFKSGELKVGNLTARMEDVKFTGSNGQLKAGKVKVTGSNNKVNITARNVVTDNMQIDNKTFITEVSGIRWDEANVQITGSQGTNEIAPTFIIRKINGSNTSLSISSEKQQLTAYLETVSAKEFVPLKDQVPKITELRAKGKSFDFKKGSRQLSIRGFNLNDGDRSEFNNFYFANNTPGDSIQVTIPTIIFTPDLNAILNGAVVADNVDISLPTFRIKQDAAAVSGTTASKELPVMNIGNLRMKQPDFLLNNPGSDGFTKIEWRRKEGVNDYVEVKGIKITKDSAVTIASLGLAIRNFSFTAAGKSFDAGEADLITRLDNFSLLPSETDGWDWHGIIGDLKANNFLIDSIGTQAGTLKISTARLGNLAIGSETLLNLRQLVKENKSFRLNEVTGSYSNTDIKFDWNNASYDKVSKTFTMDSLNFRPTLDQEEFIATSKYQSDYLSIQTGAISAGPFDIDRYLADTILDAGTVRIDDARLLDFRDKRLPFKGGIEKPLPVNLLKKFPVKLSVDTILVTNAKIQYEELNNKTNQTGVVKLHGLNASIAAARNYDHRPGDSLRIAARAILMDSIDLDIRVIESYTDSLAGFVMTARVPGTDPKQLNTILLPLASVQLESGIVDSLSMYVIGNEHYATGEMKLHYHDLKVKVLNNKPGEKVKKRGFLTFLANTFFIRKNNRSKTGTVFFQRMKERSALQYMVKIALSGITHSIGAKNNKKQLKRYKKRNF